MNIKVRYLTIIVVGMLITTDIVAAEKFSLVGPGVASCGKFLETKQRDESLSSAYFSWAQGYMTALNLPYVTYETLTDLSGVPGQKIWLKNYCEQNVFNLYVEAVQALWIELRNKQGLEPDPRPFRYTPTQ